jgi:lipopolysaccharide export system protein LptC
MPTAPPIEHPWRLLLLVVAVLVTSVPALRARYASEEPAPRAELDRGYYLKDAVLSGTGADGRLLYRVRTRAAEQLLPEGTIDLDSVIVDYFPAAELPWRLESERGQIPPDRTIIELSGNVVLSSGAPPMEIRTEELELDPDAYIASTDLPVTVERARDSIEARGLRVYLKEDRLQFIADVRGRFAP